MAGSRRSLVFALALLVLFPLATFDHHDDFGRVDEAGVGANGHGPFVPCAPAPTVPCAACAVSTAIASPLSDLGSVVPELLTVPSARAELAAPPNAHRSESGRSPPSA